MRRYKTERKYYAVNMTQFNSLLLDLHVPDQVRRLGPTIFTRVRAHKCIGQIHPEGLDHSSALRHLHRAGPTPATSAPGLGSPLLHLHRDWARRCYIYTGTGPTPATSAPGLGPPLPHLHRNWAHPCHICTGTGPCSAHTQSKDIFGTPLDLLGTKVLSVLGYAVSCISYVALPSLLRVCACALPFALCTATLG